MRIALFCATARGAAFLRELRALAPDAQLDVYSFREEPWEPPFLDTIAAAAAELHASFREVRAIGADAFHGCDVLLAVSWRYMIPKDVYSRATKGAYVFHDSLLPEYRGFSPTVWAIANGEDHTGVTILVMAEGVDEGDIVDQRRVPIGAGDTIADVMQRVTATYLELLRANLAKLTTGAADAKPQDHARATYCCKRVPEDNAIDWTRGSAEILDLIRAVTQPYPGAFTTLDGAKLIVWSASALPADARRFVGRIPGRVAGPHGDGVIVLTGDGGIVVREVQKEGEPRMPAPQVLRKLGTTLGR